MRADARSGEAEYQYADGQNSYLSELASLPTFVPKQPDPAATAGSQPTSQDVIVEQKTRKLRVGEPAPRQDQIGNGEARGRNRSVFVLWADRA